MEDADLEGDSRHAAHDNNGNWCSDCECEIGNGASMNTIQSVDEQRGHKFLPTKSESTKIPKLYKTDGIQDKQAYIHYFIGEWDWYILELDLETKQAFGLVFSMYTDSQGELGYVDLEELALVRAGLYKQPVERDLHWNPKTIDQIRNEREAR